MRGYPNAKKAPYNDMQKAILKKIDSPAMHLLLYLQ
jgi:hypothetical protein